MTSISQQPPLTNQPQQAAQTASQVHSPSASIGGTTSPLAAVPAPTARSYANASKKQLPPSNASDTVNSPVAVGSQGPPQHEQSGSTSPANGNPIPPAVPSVSTPTIVNGNNSDHSRKPSVTISAAGATGYIPNGGPVAGPQSRPSSIQFGFMNAGGSPAQGNATLHNQSPSMLGVTPMNPRISSPQNSPSPIPQPAASGGRPPSSLQGQGNAPIFGNLGGESNERQFRPGPQGQIPPGPQTQHLRRESSQSAHGDVGNPTIGGGRGAYPPSGGRGGRNFSQHPPYSQNIPYSPSPAYRTMPNQPRGNPNVPPPFPSQGRPLGPPYNSPSLAARSPAMGNSHPATPQMGHVPMATPQMPAQHYGAYSQPHHMGHQTQNFMQPAFDQYGNPYYHQPYAQPGMPPAPMYMQPQSPRPPFGVPQMGQQPQAPYMQQQYSNSPQPQAPPLSRSSSQVSANDRPTSAAGQAPPPAVTPSSGHSHTASRATSSPVPKPSTNNFVIPTRGKSSGIVIKDPTTNAVINPFDKTPASPARATPSPVKAAGTPTSTPPPPSSTPHTRSESASGKSSEEKKKEMQAAVAMRIEEAERKKKDEEAERSRKEKEDLEAKEREANEAKAKAEAEEREKLEKEKAEKAKAAEEAKASNGSEDAKVVESTKPEDAKATEAEQPASAEDEMERIIREMEEKEAAERAAEEEYEKKKAAKKEEEARKAAQEEAAYLANLKNAEREAEALEEERIKKRTEAEQARSKSDSADLFASLKSKGASTPTPTDSPAARTPAESGTATPVSDTPMPPPLRAPNGGKQKPAALKLETKKPVEPPQPSAALQSLRSARFLTAFDSVAYPSQVQSPNPSLNARAQDKKFKYNKEFLLQFQQVFKDKPSEDWDAKVRDTVGEPTDSARPQSAARTPGVGSGGRAPSGRGPAPPSAFQMGTMGTFAASKPLPPGTTSEQRFAMSNATIAAQRPASVNNPFGQFGRAGLPMGAHPMSRTNSSTGATQVPPSPRVGGASQRGTRTSSKRDRQNHKQLEEANKTMPLTAGMDLTPLKPSAGGWKPRSVGQGVVAAGPAPGGEGHMAPDVVQRKVKSNLNKMTPENFEKISTQILDIASQSKNETDGRTLRQVIQLTFEKATDEAHWATMYAKFCQKMLHSMSPDIKDEGIRDKQGNVVVGGNLFRKYLLNRCQEEFERGWKVNLPEAPEGGDEAAMMSDDYYLAAAAKRRGLGLVKFIGELFKLGMLTERIMHECVKKLLEFEGTPDEAEVESLTSLLRTIGAHLDSTEKGQPAMGAYFIRIENMIEIPELPSRLKFMLMDIRDLRKSGWQSRDSSKGPMTIQQIREEAAQQARDAEMEKMRQQSQRGPGGRMGPGRGDTRNFSGGGYGQMPPPADYSSKVGSDDLRRLNRRDNRQSGQATTAVFGPGGLLSTRSNSGRKGFGPSASRGGDESGPNSRTSTPPAQKDRDKKDEKDASHANTFSALANLTDSERHDGSSPPSVTASPPQVMSRPAIERQRSKSPNKDANPSSGAGRP